RDLSPMEQIQQEASVAFETLVRASTANSAATLESLRDEAAHSVDQIDNLLSGLDPDVSLALIAPLSRLRNNAIGHSSIIAAGKVEQETSAEGRRLTMENSELSAQLSKAVASLVAQSKRGIAAATQESQAV